MFKDLFLLLCMYVSRCVRGPGARFPEAVVTGGCEPPRARHAGMQTWVLCNNSIYVLLTSEPQLCLLVFKTESHTAAMAGLQLIR